MIDLTTELEEPWRTLGFESGPPSVDFMEALHRYRTLRRQLLDNEEKSTIDAAPEPKDRHDSLDSAFSQIAGMEVCRLLAEAGTPGIALEVPFEYRNHLWASGAAQRIGALLAFSSARFQRLAFVLKVFDEHRRVVVIIRVGEPTPGNRILACFPDGQVFDITDDGADIAGISVRQLWFNLLQHGQAVPPNDWRADAAVDGATGLAALRAAARARTGDLGLYFTSRCPKCLRSWQATFPGDRCIFANCGATLSSGAHSGQEPETLDHRQALAVPPHIEGAEAGPASRQEAAVSPPDDPQKAGPPRNWKERRREAKLEKYEQEFADRMAARERNKEKHLERRLEEWTKYGYSVATHEDLARKAVSDRRDVIQALTQLEQAEALVAALDSQSDERVRQAREDELKGARRRLTNSRIDLQGSDRLLDAYEETHRRYMVAHNGEFVGLAHFDHSALYEPTRPRRRVQHVDPAEIVRY